MSYLEIQISQKLVDHVKRCQPLKLSAWQDVDLTWTIGYGHTYNVHMGDVITQEQADKFLMEDLHYAVGQVMQILPSAPQNRIDALADFTLELGFETLKRSNLLMRILQNPEDFSSIAYEFSRWSYSKGRRDPSKVYRRSWEIQTYKGVI